MTGLSLLIIGNRIAKPSYAFVNHAGDGYVGPPAMYLRFKIPKGEVFVSDDTSTFFVIFLETSISA
jgi:hypothetical protein